MLFLHVILQIRYKGKSLDLYKSKWMKENMASEVSSASPLTLTVSNLSQIIGFIGAGVHKNTIYCETITIKHSQLENLEDLSCRQIICQFKVLNSVVCQCKTEGPDQFYCQCIDKSLLETTHFQIFVRSTQVYLSHTASDRVSSLHPKVRTFTLT